MACCWAAFTACSGWGYACLRHHAHRQYRAGDFIVAAAFVGLSLSQSVPGVQPLLWIVPIGLLFLALGYS